MNIHEYQAKPLLATYGVPIQPGAVAYTPEEAERVAKEIGGEGWAVKAQILAGGRASAGGVRLVNTLADVRETAARMLGETIATAQTGDAGETVNRVYVEQAAEFTRELYLGMVVDRATAQLTLMASPNGGTGIETQHGTADQVTQVAIKSESGPSSADIRNLATTLHLNESEGENFARIVRAIVEAFVELDASLIELNPLVVSRGGGLIALDAKMSFDENALFRHKNIADLRSDSDDANRFERARHGFNYLKLGGNIGCMVNGAALAMATMDILKLHGGKPANFLDVPPAATHEEISRAFKLVLSDASVKAVLVNIVGGGITRCDAVAEGIAGAVSALSRRVPLVVRFEGTNRDLGKKTLRDTGVQFHAADTLADAAEQVVKAARSA